MTERTAVEAGASGGGTPAGVKGAMVEFVNELTRPSARTSNRNCKHRTNA